MDSHVVPKGVYRRIRKAYHEPVNSLVHVNDISVLVSNELKELMLCEVCEARLKVGEDYFYGLVDESEKQTLGAAVAFSKQPFSDAGVSAIDLSAAKIEVTLVAHFVLGVFWRCCVSTLRELSEYHSTLGEKLTDEIRLFLLGEAGFPDKCFLRLIVYDDEMAFPILCPPVLSRESVAGHRIWSHKMHFLGISFELYRGGRESLFPKDSGFPCLGRVYFKSENFLTSNLHRQLIGKVRDADAKGKLAELFPNGE